LVDTIDFVVGDAQPILQQAEGYKQKVVNEAHGQTARFLQVYDQ